MARTHNALDASLLGPAIRAALGIKDGTETIERFSETLDPTIDLWGRPEWAFLRNELNWSRADEITGVAAQNSQAYVVNPAASGKIVVVKSCAAVRNDGGTTTVLYHIASEAQVTALGLAGTIRVFARDLRWASNTIAVKQGTTEVVEGTAAALAGSQIGRSITSASRPDVLDVVLPPGTALGVIASVVAQTLEWWFMGYERKALAGELLT